MDEPNVNHDTSKLENNAHGEMNHTHSGHMDQSDHAAHDHSGHMGMDQSDHAAHDHSGHMDMDQSDHAAHDHSTHMDMDHSNHAGHAHSGHMEQSDMAAHEQPAEMGPEEHIANEHTDHAGHNNQTKQNDMEQDHSAHDHADHAQSNLEHMDHGGQHSDHTAHDNADHSAHSSHDGDHSDHSDHGNHSDHDHSGLLSHAAHMGNIKQKFIISLILSIPIFYLAPFMGRSFFWQFSFPGSDWVVLVFATLLFFYGGWPFLMGAKMELQERRPAMMTLISLGITTSYIYSVYAFIANNILHSDVHVMDFFWELATLILIMLLGHWVENNAIDSAGNALQRMAELLPGTASVVDAQGNINEVDLKDVMIGDHLIVRAGDKVPTDGIILEGKTTVNESLLTGEAKAVSKKVHDEVIGGSVNGSGSITIEVTGTGESGFLAQVMDLVSTAQREKSRVETLSDKVAKWLFYTAVIVGVIAFIVWFIISDLSVAVERMVTVFVIACPHALGLAVPLVTANIRIKTIPS